MVVTPPTGPACHARKFNWTWPLSDRVIDQWHSSDQLPKKSNHQQVSLWSHDHHGINVLIIWASQSSATNSVLPSGSVWKYICACNCRSADMWPSGVTWNSPHTIWCGTDPVISSPRATSGLPPSLSDPREVNCKHAHSTTVLLLFWKSVVSLT